MRRIFNREKGALNGYIIGVACLAFVIVGGVFLLRYMDKQRVDSETNTVETVNTENPGDDEEKNDDETPTQRPVIEQPDPTPEPEKPSTPAPSIPSDTPDSISNAGPTELASSMIGMLMIGVTGYMAWNYRLARVAVMKSRMKK